MSEPERTTSVIGNAETTGLPCENCGMPYDKCTAKMMRSTGVGSTCCGRCHYTDTHAVQKVPATPAAPPQATVHIAIGNSDDKLTQADWAEFVRHVDNAVRGASGVVHGAWHSLPNAQWQNAAWAFQSIGGASRVALRKALADLAVRYRQDTIAWNESITEFIYAKPLGTGGR